MGGFFGGNVTGFTLKLTSRQYGPQAGVNATGNRVVMIGTGAGNGTNISDAVILGTAALDAAFTDPGVTQSGAVIIGSGAYGALTAPGNVAAAANVAIGHNVGALDTFGHSNVLVGDQVLSTETDAIGSASRFNVVLGALAMHNYNGVTGPSRDNVVIGYHAGDANAATSAVIDTSVIIGSLALGTMGVGVFGVHTSVVIGSGAAPNINGTSQDCVMIGAGVGTGCSTANDCIMVGETNVSAAGPVRSIAIGNAANSGNTDNIVIGHNAGTVGGAKAFATGAIAIGVGAGSQAANPNFSVAIEYAALPAVFHPLIYGRMDLGNVGLGTILAADRADLDLAGSASNIKIANGTKGSAAPTNGGYFYVLAGALHWVGSGGTDTVVAPA